MSNEYKITIEGDLSGLGALSSIAANAETSLGNLDRTVGKISVTLSTMAKDMRGVTTSVNKNSTAAKTAARVYSSLYSAVQAYKLAMDVAKISTEALSSATKRSPWGFLAAGISLAVSALSSFSKKQEEVTLFNQESIDSIYRERLQVSLLTEELKKVETPLSRRKEIIKELNEIQPELVRNITAESVAYDQLSTNLDNYVQNMIKKAAFEKRRGEIEPGIQAAADALNEKESIGREVPGAINYIFNKLINHVGSVNTGENQAERIREVEAYREKALSQWFDSQTVPNSLFPIEWAPEGFFSDYESRKHKGTLGSYYLASKKAKRLENEAQADWDDLYTPKDYKYYIANPDQHKAVTPTQLPPEYRRPIARSLKNEEVWDLINSDSGSYRNTGNSEDNTLTATVTGMATDVSSRIPGAETASSNIMTGGNANQRIVNINVQRFMDTMTNTFNGTDVNDDRHKANEVLDFFNQAFLRILNSANQTA